MYLDPDYEFIAIRKEELCESFGLVWLLIALR